MWPHNSHCYQGKHIPRLPPPAPDLVPGVCPDFLCVRCSTTLAPLHRPSSYNSTCSSPTHQLLRAARCPFCAQLGGGARCRRSSWSTSNSAAAHPPLVSPGSDSDNQSKEPRRQQPNPAEFASGRNHFESCPVSTAPSVIVHRRWWLVKRAPARRKLVEFH